MDNKFIIENVVIPNGITSMGAYAFSKCASLTEIEIPNSVTSIGKYAFYGCEGLKAIKSPKDCQCSKCWNDNCDAEIIYY